MKPFAFTAALGALILPVFVHAQTFNGAVLGAYTAGIIDFINKYLIPFIWAIAFIVFLWGVYSYFIAGGADEEKRSQGKQLVMWAVIGFVIMTSLWGIVNLLTNSFGFGGQNAPKPPTFNPGAASAPLSPSPASPTPPPTTPPAPVLDPGSTFY